MINKILERIESRLEALEMDAATASMKAVGNKDAIRNIKRGLASGRKGAGVNAETLLKLAPVLKTSASWLLEGVECGPEVLSPSMVQLWEVLKKASDFPAVQDRIIAFAEFELANYAKSLDTETKPS